MNSAFNIYELFAFAFSYPNEEVRLEVDRIYISLRNNHPEAYELITEFWEFTQSVSMWKWEEIYTRTFDVQSISTLDIGYALFGDDYKRGELLVNLSREHNNAGITCGTELADHLPNVLKLITRLENEEIKNDLIKLIIIPALKKIIAEFENNNIDKKNKVYRKHHKILIQEEKEYGTVYQSLLKSLLSVIENDSSANKIPVIDDDRFNSKFANEMEIPE